MIEYGKHVTGHPHMQETQIKAYELALGDVQRKEAAVLNAVAGMGGEATLWQLEIALNQPMHWISGRVRRLVQMGKLYDTGQRLVNPKSGKGGTVWAIK